MSGRKRLGELLVEAKVITPQQLGTALQAQLIYGGRLGTNLVELDYITERFLAEFLARKLRVPAILEVSELLDIPADVTASFPRELAEKYQAIPLKREKKILELAMVDPTDLRALDELRFRTGCEIRAKVAPEIYVVAALERLYEVPRKTRYIRLAGGGAAPPPTAVPAPRPLPPAPDLQPETPESPDVVELLDELPDLSSELAVSVPPNDPHARIAALVQSLAAAPNEVAVLQVVFGVWNEFFDGKLIGFAVFPDRLTVATATGPAEFRARASAISVPLHQPHVLQRVYESQRSWLGVPEGSAENAALLEALDDDPTTPMLAMPLLVQSRVEYLLVGLGPRHTLTDTPLRMLSLVLDKAGIAVEIQHLKRRLLRVPTLS